MKTAIAYVRVSTDEQHLGPQAQRSAIEEWAAREGIAVVGWHSDHGIGGAVPLDSRPGLLEAVAQLRRRSGQVLVVAKRDRLARDVVVAALVERLVERYGGRLVSADGVGVGDGPEAKFMRTIVDAAAEYERALIRMRTKLALGAKRTRGERIGTCPFGFGADADRIVRNEGEQAIVSRVVELSRSGLSTRAIVRQLRSEGAAGRTGRPLQQTQVVRILRASRLGEPPSPETPTRRRVSGAMDGTMEP